MTLSIGNGSQNLILLVEPSAALHKKVRNTFQNSNLRLLTATTGRAALELLQKRTTPLLAIIEMALPDMDGGELARKIYTDKHIPIIMTGYYADPPIVADLLNVVAEDFIHKPFDERELIARAIRLLPRYLRPSLTDNMFPGANHMQTDYSRGQFRLVN